MGEAAVAAVEEAADAAGFGWSPSPFQAVPSEPWVEAGPWDPQLPLRRPAWQSAAAACGAGST